MASLEQRLELDKIDIAQSRELGDLILKVFPHDPMSLHFHVNSVYAPLFIYTESLSRDRSGLISRNGTKVCYYIADTSNNASIRCAAERKLLRTNKNISDSNRGDILVAFCRLELIVDAILFYSEGIYSGEVAYKDFYNKMMKDGSAPFHVFENKKRYIRKKRLITKETARYLTHAQTVRNIIAHQYFLDFDKNSLDEIKEYANFTIQEKIEDIFNRAWLYLLQDYNPLQVEVLKGINQLSQ